MRALASIMAVWIALASLGGASAPPASRPAVPPTPVELSPLGRLRAYNDAMLNGDKADLLARSHVTTDEGRRMAQAITAHDALVGKILKMAREKFDDQGAHVIGQTLGDIGNADLVNASFTIDGDRAVVSAGGGVGDTHMVLHNGQWKLDFDKHAGDRGRFGASIDDLLANLAEKTATAQALHKAMEAGSIKSVDDALYVIRRNP